jgi:hypothetical protein
MQRFNKGLVALLGVLVEGALLVWGGDLGIDDESLPAVLTALTALTGVGVYRVPNRPGHEAGPAAPPAPGGQP